MVTRPPAGGQLDLFALLETAKLDGPAPTLFGSPARGLDARNTEMARWRDAHSNFASSRRSHAWTVNITCPDTATDRCQPTVLSADLRCDCRRADCFCLGDLLYRGACRACDWEGDPRDGENPAAEDACDHAWPGWRELPTVTTPPEESKARARWLDKVTGLYPAGWLDNGGPIRTARTGIGTRHVPCRTPAGGYDLAAVNNRTQPTGAQQ